MSHENDFCPAHFRPLSDFADFQEYSDPVEATALRDDGPAPSSVGVDDGFSGFSDFDGHASAFGITRDENLISAFADETLQDSGFINEVLDEVAPDVNDLGLPLGGIMDDGPGPSELVHCIRSHADEDYLNSGEYRYTLPEVGY